MKTILKYIIISMFVFAAGFIVVNQQEWGVYFHERDWETLRALMGEEWKYILFITFIFMIMQNVVSLIPFLLLTMFNIWLFGFFYGYLWSLTGNFLGSVLVFYLARYVLQNWAQKFNHNEIKRKIEKNGFKVILFMRLFPFMPASIVNIGSGISNIKAKDYILATLIGNTIFVFLLALFSAGLISLQYQNTLYVFLTVFLLAIAGIQFKKEKAKKKRLGMTNA